MYTELLNATKTTIANIENTIILLTNIKKDVLGYSGVFAAAAYKEQPKHNDDNNIILENLASNNLVPIKFNQEEQVMKYKGVTIFKRKDGNTYYARYRYDGKQHYISDRTKKGCYALLKKAMDNKTEIENKKYKTTTFEEWYAQWLKLFKTEVKQSTLVNYNYMYKNLTPEFIDSEMLKITPIHIIEILNTIAGTRQRQKVYEWLKDIFNRAYLYKIVKENIFNIIDKPKHTSKKTIALTQEQEQIFITECRKNKYGLFYLICLMQGLRRGECLALTFNDFDLKNKTLTINKSINEKTTDINTKNEYSNRVMPLFNRTIAEVCRFNFKSGERLFNVSTKPLHENFKQILNSANLPDIKIHELRHTFITRMQELNVPEFVVQSWVGHELGSKVTKKVYTHVNQQDLLLYNNKVNEKLQPTELTPNS